MGGSVYTHCTIQIIQCSTVVVVVLLKILLLYIKGFYILHICSGENIFIHINMSLLFLLYLLDSFELTRDVLVITCVYLYLWWSVLILLFTFAKMSIRCSILFICSSSSVLNVSSRGSSSPRCGSKPARCSQWNANEPNVTPISASH